MMHEYSAFTGSFSSSPASASLHTELLLMMQASKLVVLTKVSCLKPLTDVTKSSTSEILQNYTQEYVWTPRETHLLHSLVTYMYINIYIADLLLCASTHSMWPHSRTQWNCELRLLDWRKYTVLVSVNCTGVLSLIWLVLYCSGTVKQAYIYPSSQSWI